MVKAGDVIENSITGGKIRFSKTAYDANSDGFPWTPMGCCSEHIHPD